MSDDPEIPSVPGWGFDADTLASLRLERAERALAKDDPTTALVEAEELLDVAPDHVLALWIVGQAATELGDPAMAAEALDALVRRRPDHAAAWALLAQARLEAGLLGPAELAATQALARPDIADGPRADAHFVRGLLRVRAGEPAGWDDLKQAAALAPDRWPLPQPLAFGTWARAVSRAQGLLAPTTRAFLEGVALETHPWPTADQLDRAVPTSSALAGALAAGPLPAEDPWAERPSVVLLFSENLAYPPPAPPAELARRIAAALDDFVDAWTGGSDDEAE